MQKPLLFAVTGALLLSAAAPLATASHDASDGKLDFVLTSADAGDGSGHKVMLQEEHPTENDDTVTFNGCQTWQSDQAAEVDLTFDAQDIDYTLSAPQPASGTTVEIGVLSGGTTDFTATQSPGSGLDGTVTISEMPLNEGDRVVLEVCEDVNGNLAIHADGTSVATFQSSDSSNYPTLELSSLVLSGVGLLAILGIAQYRRKDR